MKKLVVTFVMILGLATVSFGQSLFGKSSNEEPLRDAPGIVFPGHGETGHLDSDGPLGSGIAILVGLGAAYAFSKKRKE